MTSKTSAQIHDMLGHPVVDADAHWVEPFPIYADYLATVGGAKLVDAYTAEATRATTAWYKASTEERRERNIMRTAFRLVPAGTLDFATASLPGLLNERLGELGIDFAVTYPTQGLRLLAFDDPEIRVAGCRALNRMSAELFADYAAHLTPVAVIPTANPQEAIDELNYAVGELGMKSIVIYGHTVRSPKGPGAGPFVDFYGIDSYFDYDPFWNRCVELGVPVTAHGAALGWMNRRSPSNFAMNHVGLFQESNHAFCKAITFGGVAKRFPELHFAFLEGGTAWAASLYADIVEHWKMRNADAVDALLRPSNIDFVQLGELWKKYAAPKAKDKFEEILQTPYPFYPFVNAAELSARDDGWDDFAEIPGLADVTTWFTERYFFGCEAEDPTVPFGFNGGIGARLQPVMGSDIGHFDVTNMAEVIAEAYELVEDGLLNEEDFKDFTYTNAVKLHTAQNPSFFEGTVVQDQVGAELSGTGSH
jgi:hypothetical protein